MPTPQATPGGTRRWFTTIAALGGMTGLTTRVSAQPVPGAPPHGLGPARSPSPEHMARAIEHRIGGLIKSVDGTPEQKERLLKLAQTAMADMQPMRIQRMAARRKGMDLLAASAIDRNALELLRQEHITLADSMSRRVVQHMADAAEVLTPAQRSKLAGRMREQSAHGPHGGRDAWGGGMGFGGLWGR